MLETVSPVTVMRFCASACAVLLGSCRYALAFVRQWQDAVHPGSAKGNTSRIGYQGQTSLRRLWGAPQATTAGSLSFFVTPNSANGPDTSAKHSMGRISTAPKMADAAAGLGSSFRFTVHRCHLHELRFHGVLQCPCFGRSSNSRNSWTGGASWLSLRRFKKLSLSLQGWA